MYCFSQLCGLSGWLFLRGIIRVATLSWQICCGLGSADAVDWRPPSPSTGPWAFSCVSRHNKKKHCKGVKMEATGTSESLDAEAIQCHFSCILQVKASHRASPDPRERGNGLHLMREAASLTAKGIQDGRCCSHLRK